MQSRSLTECQRRHPLRVSVCGAIVRPRARDERVVALLCLWHTLYARQACVVQCECDMCDATAAGAGALVYYSTYCKRFSMLDQPQSP